MLTLFVLRSFFQTFCMNISAPFIVQVPPFFETFKKALEHVDILFGNESEAVAFAEAAGLEVRFVTFGVFKKKSSPQSSAL